MHEKEEKKKLEKRIAMMLLYPYVYDNIYCCVLEVFFVLTTLQSTEMSEWVSK